MINEKFIPIVLCAGFGTRLKPITNYIPKVACPIIDKPLAFFGIEKFFDAGFKKVYCNVHYKADIAKKIFREYAKKRNYDPDRLVFFDEVEILGSGGGILNIFNNLCKQDESNKKKDLIVVSGDVVADFPLQDMITCWENKTKFDQALMLSLELTEMRDDVLCVSNDLKNVIGFGKKFLEDNKDINFQKRIFSNHQIISSDVCNEQELKFASSIDMFYKKILSNSEHKIMHMEYPKSSYWFNVGDIIEYQKCFDYFSERKIS